MSPAVADLPEPWGQDALLRSHPAAGHVVEAWTTPSAVVVVLAATDGRLAVVGLGVPESVGAVLGDLARSRATDSAGRHGGLDVFRSATSATLVRGAFEVLDDEEVTALGLSAASSSAGVAWVDPESGHPYPLLTRAVHGAVPR